VDHSLRIGGANYSSFLKDVTLDENMGKDTQARITLNNTDFRLSNDKALSVPGHIVKLKLFDGQRWRTFDDLKLIEPARNYTAEGTIVLTCRSKAIDFQFQEVSQKWEQKTDSDVVNDIALINGLATNIEPTTDIRDEISLSNEPVSTFLNKLAKRNGYEWRVENNALYFRRPQGKKTNIVLRYRPFGRRGLIGSIISAKFKLKEDSKSGKDSLAKVPALDFNKGTTDTDTVDALGRSQNGKSLNKSSSPTGRRQGENPLRRDLIDVQTVGYRVEPIEGVIEPIKKSVVRHSEVASSEDEAKRLADGLDGTNAYNQSLVIETYGQVEIRLRNIIGIRGLATQDNGNWLVSGIKHKYAARNAYRMTLNNVAADKTGGRGVRGDVGSANVRKESQTQKGQAFVVSERGVPGKIIRSSVDQAKFLAEQR
jgi:phage protein D